MIKTKQNSIAKKMIVYAIIFLHVLQGCSVTGGNSVSKVGPKPSSAYEVQENEVLFLTRKLDVIIPIFDPGLSETMENYEEEGIWPELRRAEANRFAYKLKQALDNSKAFGAVRVTPDKTASGDLYVLGKIEESNGQDVVFDLSVIDISGRELLNDSFNHEVQESFYKNNRNSGKDAYDPIFKQAADEIIEAMEGYSEPELDKLKVIAELKFGASFNEIAFAEYMEVDGGETELISKPSDQDPLLQRVKAIRVREQLFVDNLQQNYQAFSQNMNNSYLAWQEANFIEQKLHSDARWEGVYKTTGGVLLVALAIAAGLYGLPIPIETVAILGGIGGAILVTGGYKSIEEAEFHKEAINELGESINLDMSSQVISFEEENVNLTGNIQEQFVQWREFLNRIYEQETTPDIKL